MRSRSNTLGLVTVTPTLQTGAYSANDCVGGLLTLSSAVRMEAAGGILDHFVLIDITQTDAALQVVFFTQDPENSTLTDAATEGIATADAAKILHIEEIATGDWIDLQNLSIVKPDIRKTFVLPRDSADLFAAIVCTGTPTFGNAGALVLRTGVIGD